MEKEANNTQKQKFELTNDNILHCLIHAATREDIAELRRELNDKVDAKASKADMAELKSELKSDMHEIRQEMQALRKDNNKYFRWIVGLMFGSFAGIAIMILKFPLIK